MEAGEIIKIGDLQFKRPQRGLPVDHVGLLIGTKATRDIGTGEVVWSVI
jgi:sialic acid synthase SpsE